jgi:hypothetical protein
MSSLNAPAGAAGVPCRSAWLLISGDSLGF